MWNKIETQEVKALKAKIKDLNNQLADAAVKNMNMNIEKLKTNVIVYLKNNKVLMVHDADEFIHDDDNDYVFIYKDDDLVASVKNEDVIAISTNSISLDEPVCFYTHNGNVDRL